MIIKEKNYGNINYIISFPNDFKNTKKYPLIFFLHGAGNRGDKLSDVIGNPFYKIIGKHDEFNFITVAPQCNKDTWFDMFTELIDFCKYIADSEFVDLNHFYGMGASMGGYGIWQLAMSCPECFAAIVPICGGGMYWNAARLKNVPIWAFHGDSDPVVDKTESVKMVEAVKACGGSAKLKIYENCGHDAWSETYGNTEVYAWLLKNCKTEYTNVNRTFNDSKKFG